MTATNIDVKLAAINKNVKLYELPKQLNITQTAFEKLMRVPLTDEMKEKIIKAINEIADSR